jgi:hypothetical protein
MEFIFSIGVNFSQVLTGGVLVAHKFCYEVARRGYKVTIFTEPEYPHPNIQVRKDSSENNLNFEYDPETTIIFPSFNWKNNTNIKNVGRWALYHLEHEQTTNVDESDEIYNFGTFNVPINKPYHQLTVFDYQQNVFFNKGQRRDKKYCHIMLKNNPEFCHGMIQYFNSTNLDDYKSRGCYVYLAEKFNEFEYFLTFDDKTFLTTAAALCGCKSIILKNNSISPIEYRNNNPIQSFGVAYGIDDLNWAEKTIDFVPNYIKFRETQDQKTIDDMIEFWEKKLL